MTAHQPTRTIVLAGATSGLVRRAAEQLADAGHRLVLIGRDPRRAKSLARSLPTAHVIAADLSTAAGVQHVSAEVREVVDRVDTLVNGAGVMLPTRRTTAEGLEMNFAVHHLAPFSLTSALLDQLRRGDGRVVNVNSAGHHTPMRGTGPVELDFTDLQSERHYDPFLAYSRSKLANLLFSYEVHRRHPELTVAAVHPGVIRTDLGRHFPRIQVAVIKAMSLPVDQGAAPVVRLATDPNIRAGAYYDGFHATASSPPSYNAAAAERLWTITEQLRGPFDRSVQRARPNDRSGDLF